MPVFPERRFVFLLLLILPLCGVWQLGLGAWIHTKAVMAQILLEAAWSETLTTGQEVKPWPWADTWPAGSLTVPRLGIRRVVLAGASGSSLAFGPGLFFPGTRGTKEGNIIIAGHRDTHFRFLQRVKMGDIIEFQSMQNLVIRFQVSEIHVVHNTDTQFLHGDNGPGLILITCYPFDAINPGGPLRYVVMADTPVADKKML